MTFERLLQLFAYVVFTAFCFGCLRWLLNQPSDYLLIVAGLLFITYIWITVKSKLFTKNPFKK